MIIRQLILAFAGAVLICGSVLADAPLKTALGLSMDQAKVVNDIQAKHRKIFAAKRQEYHTDMRKLRRARLANDSKAVAELEAITAKQQQGLREIRASEDAAIREVLNAEQQEKFKAYIEKREAMVGSSRDTTEMKERP